MGKCKCSGQRKMTKQDDIPRECHKVLIWCACLTHFSAWDVVPSLLDHRGHIDTKREETVQACLVTAYHGLYKTIDGKIKICGCASGNSQHSTPEIKICSNIVRHHLTASGEHLVGDRVSTSGTVRSLLIVLMKCKRRSSKSCSTLEPKDELAGYTLNRRPTDVQSIKKSISITVLKYKPKTNQVLFFCWYLHFATCLHKEHKN